LIHFSLVEFGEYSTGPPILNCDGGSKRTRGYMKRTNASVPMPIELRTAPQPRKPRRSRRVGAMRQMWPSGLVPSSLFPVPATTVPLHAFPRAFYQIGPERASTRALERIAVIFSQVSRAVQEARFAPSGLLAAAGT
jgi:hypothetical protein